MLFNTLSSTNNVWFYDQTSSTKVAKQLNYSLDFIAAVKESNFTRDWFQELINQIRHEGSSHQLSECDPEMEKLSKWDKSLLVYDALSCTIFKKQKMLKDIPNSNLK